MRVEARDSYAETGIADSLKISKPIHSQQEMCFFYTMCADENGRTFAGIYNHRLALGVLIHFDGRLLDHFTQWKMMGEGEYALGLEPGNASVLGVQEETRLGHVKFLEPWESRSYRFTIQVMEGENDLRKAKAAVTRLQSNSAR